VVLTNKVVYSVSSGFVKNASDLRAQVSKEKAFIKRLERAQAERQKVNPDYYDDSIGRLWDRVRKKEAKISNLEARSEGVSRAVLAERGDVQELARSRIIKSREKIVVVPKVLVPKQSRAERRKAFGENEAFFKKNPSLYVRLSSSKGKARYGVSALSPETQSYVNKRALESRASKVFRARFEAKRSNLAGFGSVQPVPYAEGVRLVKVEPDLKKAAKSPRTFNISFSPAMSIERPSSDLNMALLPEKKSKVRRALGSWYETQGARLINLRRESAERSRKFRKNIGLGFLNPTGDESFMGKVGKGFGNVALAVSPLGWAEVTEKALIAGSTAKMAAYGLAYNPKGVKKAVVSAAKKTAPMFVPWTPEGIVTYSTALVAPLAVRGVSSFAKRGASRAAIRSFVKSAERPSGGVTSFSSKKSVFDVYSDVYKIGRKGKSLVGRTKSQSYEIITPDKPAVTVIKFRGGLGVLTNKAGFYNYKKTVLGQDYYVRSAVRGKSVSTKVFRGDVLLKSFSGEIKGSKGLLFSEPIKSSKKTAGFSKPEFSLELGSTRKLFNVYSESSRRPTFFKPGFVAEGKGVVRVNEVLGARTTRLGKASYASDFYLDENFNLREGSYRAVIDESRYKFVARPTKPKSFSYGVLDEGLFSKSPAKFKTAQEVGMSSEFKLSYRKKKSFFSEEAGRTLRSFFRSKRAQAYRSRLRRKVVVEVEKPKFDFVGGKLKGVANSFGGFRSKSSFKPGFAFVPGLSFLSLSKSKRGVSSRFSHVFDTKSVLGFKPVSMERFKVASSFGFVSRSDNKFLPVSVYKYASAAKHREASKFLPVSVGSAFGKGGFVGSGFDLPPPSPSSTPPGIGLLFGVSRKRKARKKGKAKKRAFSVFNPRYVASVEAGLFGIKSRVPDLVAAKTGLGLRRIVKL